jgi:hypothetical protein
LCTWGPEFLNYYFAAKVCLSAEICYFNCYGGCNHQLKRSIKPGERRQTLLMKLLKDHFSCFSEGHFPLRQQQQHSRTTQNSWRRRRHQPDLTLRTLWHRILDFRFSALGARQLCAQSLPTSSLERSLGAAASRLSGRVRVSSRQQFACFDEDGTMTRR